MTACIKRSTYREVTGLKDKEKLRLAGLLAGAANGCFGGGGGMVLSPLLRTWCRRDTKTALATCVAVMLPVCVTSAAVYALRGDFPWSEALPYLIGGAAGGFAGGRLFPRMASRWLRWLFAAFLLYGAWRYLT